MDHPVSSIGDEPDRPRLARLEPHRCARRYIQAETARSRAIEIERVVGFEEVIVGTDLHRTVAGIGNVNRFRLASGVQRDRSGRGNDFSGFHGEFLP